MALSSDNPPPPPSGSAGHDDNAADNSSSNNNNNSSGAKTSAASGDARGVDIETGSFDVHSVAVIGAGPCGLAAAKYLLAEGGYVFTQVDVFEQCAEVGGVWNYTPIVPGPEGHQHHHHHHKQQQQQQHQKWGIKEGEVPQTSPFVDVDEPLLLGGKDSEVQGEQKQQPVFPSPMYQELNTNIPHTLMQFSDKPFPESCEIYPTRQVVQDYLIEYAREVRHLIKFSTQVVDVSLVRPPEEQTPKSKKQFQDKWRVRTRDILSSQESEGVYDAVVVASGHFATPFIPDIPGIKEFHAAHPDIISHSKYYRHPEDPRYDCVTTGAAGNSAKVIVVGNSASGLDIASQIRTAKQQSSKQQPTVITSVQTGTSADMKQLIEDQGQVFDEARPIVKFLVDERGVEFEDGRVETGVDRILFATGYLYTFPFLKSLTSASGTETTSASNNNNNNNSSSSTTRTLLTDGRRVHGVAKHFIHIDHPTLMFPGLPVKVIPFPVAEAQAAVFSRLWSNALPLPSREVLEAWEREPEEDAETMYNSAAPASSSTIPSPEQKDKKKDEEKKKKKKKRGYHVFAEDTDGRYINELHEWAMQSEQGNNNAKSNGSNGIAARTMTTTTTTTTTTTKAKRKQPPFWDEQRIWERTIYAKARIEFLRTGKNAKTLEELGFVYPTVSS